MAHKGHGERLVTEMMVAGLSPVAFRVERVVRLKRLKKKVVKMQWVIRDMVFCETDRVVWKHGRKVWTRDGEYVEIDRGEIDNIKKKLGSYDVSVGDKVLIEEGPFCGIEIEVVERFGNKIKGLMTSGDGVYHPIYISVDKTARV